MLFLSVSSLNMSEPRKEFVGRRFYAKVSVCVHISVVDTIQITFERARVFVIYSIIYSYKQI